MPRDLTEKIKLARARLLLLHYQSHTGHIGGNLSCLDALMTLYHAVLSDTDRFILSKGHAAGALYVTLWSKGLISDEALATFCGEATSLPGHPSGSGVPGLLFATGSLGHGPSLAAGLALALKHKKEAGTVYCLCSDGEWQEGSCWEALNFAVRQRLDNLVILVDQNGLQGFGTTEEVMGITDLAPRFEVFGASVATVDGHNPDEILHVLTGTASQPGLPRIIVLRTMKGRSLHFAGKLESHYLPITKEQYEDGIQCLQAEVLS